LEKGTEVAQESNVGNNTAEQEPKKLTAKEKQELNKERKKNKNKGSDEFDVNKI
jgi:hypothetical protein